MARRNTAAHSFVVSLTTDPPHAMKTAAFSLLVCLFTLAVSGQVVDEAMIDRSFKVADGGNLHVAVSDGDVTIETHKADEVHVRVIVTASTSERARRLFEAQRFEVAHSRNTVRISTNPTGYDWRRRPWSGEPHGIHVMVVVPSTFDTDVLTSDGNIAVSSLSGTVNLRTSDGDIRTGTLSGDVATITTSDGDVVAEGFDSDTVHVRSSDGDFVFGEVGTKRFEAITSDGDVRIANLTGDATLRTSDGDLDLGRIDGSSVRAITSDGDIRIGSIRARRAVLRTSDGDISVRELATSESTVYSSDGTIDLSRVDGDLTVTASDADIRIGSIRARRAVLRTSDGDISVRELATSESTVHSSDGTIDLSRVDGDLTVTASDADIRLDLRAPGGIKATSSWGDVAIRAPEDWPADVDLRGDDVQVASRFDLREDFRDDSAVRGTINGGGFLLRVRAYDGSVALRIR